MSWEWDKDSLTFKLVEDKDKNDKNVVLEVEVENGEEIENVEGIEGEQVVKEEGNPPKTKNKTKLLLRLLKVNIIMSAIFIIGIVALPGCLVNRAEGMINNIGTVTFDINGYWDSENKIKTVEKAYAELEPKLQNKVSNYEVLINAREQYESLRVETITELAENFIKLIDDLPKGEDIEADSFNSLAEIIDAEYAYERLNQEVKDKITNYDALVQARNDYDWITNERSRIASEEKAERDRIASEEKAEREARTIDGKFYIVEEAHVVNSNYTRSIVGVLRNDSSRNYSYAQVKFTIYDSSGENIIGTALDNILDWPSGGNWKYSAMILEDGYIRYYTKPVVSVR
ncbi:MAG: FxLYD domain-containing protein [Syntrophomonadaceae bacterium]|jgi:hypothetical protein|nr:FxLYD domain-containing protein [Syntrophomonadaceae bacterium]